MRKINEIYNEIVDEKDKRLELNEINSKSKVSIMNAISWIVAAALRSMEAVMEAFGADVSDFIDSKIHGSADYYANALLQYQHGDDLVVKDGGLGYGYANKDESKQIITKVAYSQYTTDTEKDDRVLYKVAKGALGSLQALEPSELVSVKAFLNEIKFVGTNIDVTSKKGDVLVPRVTVFYDGIIPAEDMLSVIDVALKEYAQRVDFNAYVKKSDLIDVIKHLPNVTDVYIDESTIPKGGFYIYQYENNDEILPAKELGRIMDLSSGYLVESSGVGLEKDIPSFKDSITLKVG